MVYKADQSVAIQSEKKMTDQEWEELGNFASGNDDRRAKAQILATKHQVNALDNLSHSIFSHQKITGQRMERLSEAVEEFNKNSGDLAKKANWIAIVIALSAVIQLVVTVLRR
jgi:hypothetical protein